MIRRVLFASAVLAAMPAIAQPAWSAVARHRLAESMAYRGRGGMGADGAPRLAALGDEGLVEYRVALVPGRRYAIHAVCGAGCRDIDLRLYGPDGAEAAADVGDGPDPLVEVHVVGRGTWRIRLTMVRCAAATCDTAVGVFFVAD